MALKSISKKMAQNHLAFFRSWFNRVFPFEIRRQLFYSFNALYPGADHRHGGRL